MRRWLLPALLAAAACASPESRAVAFLEREVREWPARNKCFSCHNNGDAARALYAARRRGLPVDASALADTARFLARPAGWKDNDPAKEFADPLLATLQLSAALADSPDPGPALHEAAAMLRAFQGADGSWTVDADGLPGSPVTYGRTLATATARRVLRQAGGEDEAAERARAWLAGRTPAGRVLDAAALLLDEPGRRDALDALRRGQTRHGGWGPFLDTPPEVFDTSVALLALAPLGDAQDMIRRGRAFLLAEQRPDGSWPETTRPSGAESYAQRISTTGWALQALLATRK